MKTEHSNINRHKRIVDAVILVATGIDVTTKGVLEHVDIVVTNLRRVASDAYWRGQMDMIDNEGSRR